MITHLRRPALALALLLAIAPARAAPLEWHVSPTENLEHIDSALFAQAQNSIDIAAYVLTDWAIMDALKAASARNVAVRLVLDGSQFTPKNSGARILDLARSANVEIRIRPSQSYPSSGRAGAERDGQTTMPSCISRPMRLMARCCARGLPIFPTAG